MCRALAAGAGEHRALRPGSELRGEPRVLGLAGGLRKSELLQTTGFGWERAVRVLERNYSFSKGRKGRIHIYGN